MRTQTKKYTVAALCAALAIVIAGCGGGGGGGSTPPSPDVVTGMISPAGADVVKFDDLSTVTTTANSGTGAYSLKVPVSDITGSDTLWIFDGDGNFLDAVSITMPAGGGQSVSPSPSTTVLPVTPPNPPSLARRPG